MKINRPVGKNAHGQSALDIRIIQMVLNDIKDKKGKKYYTGNIDGKINNAVHEAICKFQCDNNICTTGKVEPNGPTMIKLRQKASVGVKAKIKTMSSIVTPPKYMGAAKTDAIQSIKDLISDAKDVQAFIKGKKNISKSDLEVEAYKKIEDKDNRKVVKKANKAETKKNKELYKKLKRFDRWFDVIRGKKTFKNSDTVDLSGAEQNLNHLEARANELLSITSDPQLNIYDLSKARKVAANLKYFEENEDKFKSIKAGTPAHFVRLGGYGVYKDSNKKILAKIRGPWIAILKGFPSLKSEIKAAALVHEYVHALNAKKGYINNTDIFTNGKKHIEKKKVDFSKKNIALKGGQAMYNPTSWGAYVANEEFEGD